MNPFFSIIIPTFNRENYIVRAVESVLRQDFQSYELIVVDDGSTDNTLCLLEEYKNIIIISQENLGVAAARNAGVKVSRGSWLCFLDSDDEWLSNKLSAQFEFIENNKNLHLVHTQENWVRDKKIIKKLKKHKKNGGDQFISALKMCTIGPSTVAIKKETFLKLGMFDESYRVCEDYHLWLKFTSLYDVGFIDKVLVNKYGGHVDQLSTTHIAMDYWRVKAIDWTIKNRKLNVLYKESALDILKRKCERLIKGYKKHNNLKDLDEVQGLYDFYFS